MTDKTVAQAKRAYRALDYIKAHPEDWHQEAWRCETGMCFAGRVATQAGGRWVLDAGAIDSELLHANGNDSSDNIFPVAYDGRADNGGNAITLEGRFVSARVRASRLLGLDYLEADMLFAAENKLSDPERLVAKFFGPRPE